MRLLAALAGVVTQPAHRQSDATLRTHFDRHLVGGATDAAALHFDRGLHVVERRAEDVERAPCRVSAMMSNAPYRMRSATDFLPSRHHDVGELGDDLRP